MKTFTFLFFLSIFGLFSCTQAPENSEMEKTAATTESSVSNEELAINQAVQDAYAVISFEKGEKPDYEAMKDIFMPEATLYNFRSDSVTFYDITEFTRRFKSGVDSGRSTAFHEVELGGKTEYFGNIAHRISTYVSYYNGSDEIGERGVNSFQLLKIDGKWFINSVIWDVEKDGQLIPDKYLNKKEEN